MISTRKIILSISAFALVAAMLLGVFAQPQTALAEAAWVEHAGNISPSAPGSSDTVDFWVQIGYQNWITDVRLYYTTDGSEPGINASTLAPTGTTSYANMSWDHDESTSEGTTLWYTTSLGPWSNNTVVRYKIAAWHSGGGSVKWADSDTDFPITDPSNARIFGFRVGDNPLPSWIYGSVIYNVFVDRFYDGDVSNNDYCARTDTDSDSSLTDEYCNLTNVVHGSAPTHPQDDYRYTYNGGDLDGVIDKLDYLEDLGINVLWLSPVFDNPNFFTTDDYATDDDIYFTYHGYHPSDPESVEEVFGTQTDLEDLIDEADLRGIRVILDFVPNHTSSQSAQFASASTSCASSIYYDWYTFSNCNSSADPSFTVTFPSSFAHTNETYTVYGSNDTNETFFGVQELPQIANDDADARDWVINDRADGWLTTLGHAGYRLDYAPGPSTDFWREFNDTVDPSNDIFTIAEIWLDNGPEVIRRQQGRVDAAMDFETHYLFEDFVVNGGSVDDLDTGLNYRAGLYYGDGTDADEFARGCFVDNHDMDRWSHRVDYDLSKMKVGAILMFTQPCIPVMYYGDEVGLGQEAGMYDYDGGRPEYVRERMAWGNSAPAEWQGLLNSSLLDFYQDLVSVRTDTDALQSFSPDDLTALYRHNGDRTYAYLRGTGTDSVVVALNDSDAQKTLSIPNLSVSLPYADGTVLTDLLGSGESCTVSSGQCSITLDDDTPGVILEADNSTTTVTVDFTINDYTTSWGEEMYVVGNVSELGNWTPASAAPLSWVDSDTWSGSVTFSTNAGQPIQFKFIVIQGGTTTWESISNRTYTVPSSGTGSYTGTWNTP